MCGIIAYSGHRPAVPVIMEGLSRLEYRGYDSAGVAYIQNREISLVRAPGKLSVLQAKLAKIDTQHALSGIGHTRWATHGVPNEVNAHPHLDQNRGIAIVHNGIIENYQEIKNELQTKGVAFSSDTDTEVLAHLISSFLGEEDSFVKAFSRALTRVEGTFAVAAICLSAPGRIWAARQSSPLVLGIGTGENFIASDIPAFLPYTRDVVFIEDGELIEIDAGSWKIMEVSTLKPVTRSKSRIEWDVQAAQKSGYKHFMLKEIYEQPRVIADCLAGRVDREKSRVMLPEIEDLPVPERLHIVACGTSYHAGLWASYLFETLAGIPVSVEIASEFRYRDVILGPEDQVLVISQSGETADTLAALRMAGEKGVKTLGLCNVIGSTVAREAEYRLFTQAGPEISVASTKAMCSQMTVLLLLSIFWAQKNGRADNKRISDILAGLNALPALLEAELPVLGNRAAMLAREYSKARSFLYLGRGVCYPLALEGALKLKEISYIHAEGYAAGEMKHGPIALIDPKFPTFALALNDELLPKVKSNLQEVQARAGNIVALVNPGFDLKVDSTWEIPALKWPLGSFVALPALQLFAYETAVYLGKDVDQPRNLAKSVTVE